jgi:hypothetical protein
MDRERREVAEKSALERLEREEARRKEDLRRDEERREREEKRREEERRRDEERREREEAREKTILAATSERERLMREEMAGLRRKMDDDYRAERDREVASRHAAEINQVVERQEALGEEMRAKLVAIENGGGSGGAGDLLSRLSKAKKEAAEIQAMFGDGEKMTVAETRKFDMMEKGLTSLTNLGTQVMGAMAQGPKRPGAPAAGAAAARGTGAGRTANVGPPAGWQADGDGAKLDNETFREAARKFFDIESANSGPIRLPYVCGDGTIIIPPVYVAEAAPGLRAAGVTFEEYKGHLILHPRDKAKAEPVIDALPER